MFMAGNIQAMLDNFAALLEKVTASCVQSPGQ
jgi:hypothetical protein